MAVKSLPFVDSRYSNPTLSWLSESLAATAPGTARVTARKPWLRAVDSARTVRVEVLEREAAAERKGAWQDLIGRSLESNAFMEPAFALYAAQHFAPARRPLFVFISDANKASDAGELLGLFVFEAPRRRFGSTITCWQRNFAPFGVPLLDRDRAGEALDALFGWLRRDAPQSSSLMIPTLPGDGPTARAIRDHAAAAGLSLHAFDCGKRAVLTKGGDAEEHFATALAPKRRKELNRQRRRLEDNGAVTFASASTPEQVRDAVERFLALEAKGWKGRRGTAMLDDPSLTTFVRTMTRELAREGKCRIDSLEIDGAPVAMGIMLASGTSGFLWKIAYDERLAALSPGVQFTLDFTRRQLAEAGIEHTDSCAIPDHPMIDRLWPERMAVVDLLVSTAPQYNATLGATARLVQRRRDMRDFAKRSYHRLMRIARGGK